MSREVVFSTTIPAKLQKRFNVYAAKKGIKKKELVTKALKLLMSSEK